MVRDARKMCVDIGLPQDALDRVFAAKGWEFFIQAHALLEAGVNHALVTRVKVSTGVGAANASDVSKFIERLPLRGAAGRLALLGLTELFPKPMARQIEVFAKIRNAYAHDIKLIAKTCPELLRTLPEVERQSIVDVIVTTPLRGQLTPEQDPVDLVEPVSKLTLLGLLAWVTQFKSPRSLLALGFAPAAKS